MSNQRIYLVGAGVIAREHAEAASHLSGEVTLSAADPDSEAREAFAEEFPDARLFEDAAGMLDEPAREDDVVVVGTPPSTHADLAIRGFESGRHVLSEKPLALDFDEADAMLAAASEADRLLGCCACRFAATPPTETVRDYLDGGALDELYHVTWRSRSQRNRGGIEYQPESRWFLDSEKSGGGALTDWGPYDFFTLHDLLDPVRATVSGAWVARPETAADPEGVPNDVEQHAGATIAYDFGDAESITVSYERSACTHGHANSTFEIEGTGGALRWDWVDDEATVRVSYDEDGRVVTEEIDHEGEDAESHAKPLAFFERAVRGEDTPIALGEDALFNFAVVRAIYEAADEGGSVLVERADGTVTMERGSALVE